MCGTVPEVWLQMQQALLYALSAFRARSRANQVISSRSCIDLCNKANSDRSAYAAKSQYVLIRTKYGSKDD